VKYLIVVPDGMSDLPEDFEDGRTPLVCAESSTMDSLADRSAVGWAETVPGKMDPGSDVAALSIFGLYPPSYYTGRSPLEAASLGLEIGDGVAYRCNLVTVRGGIMEDFTAGHITSQEAERIIRSLDQALGGEGLSFHAGVSYRHVMLAPRDYLDADCVPPHDITDQKVENHLPKGPARSCLVGLMKESRYYLRKHPVNERRVSEGKRPATQIWLWGQGTKPYLPLMKDRFGITGAVITAVDLVKGIGLLLGLSSINVPGATGFVDTNYEGKAQAALEALERDDFVYAHIEAPDEAGHQGDAELKRQAISDFDGRFLKPLIDGLNSKGDLQPYRILLLPDHPTPISVKTHVRKHVPFLLFDSRDPGVKASGGFTEENIGKRSSEVIPGHRLIELLLERSG